MKKHKKTVLSVVLALTMLMGLVFAVTAVAEQSAADYKATFKLGDKEYVVNGSATTMDVAAFSEDGRIYVPFRYLGYALGVAENDINWDAASKTAILTKDDVTVEFTLDKAQYKVNDAAKTMDVAPLSRDGRIFLPARYVAQEFGYQVDWDAESKTVIVTGVADADDPSVTEDTYGEKSDSDVLLSVD